MIKIYHPHCFNKLPDAVLFDIDNTLYPYDPAHEAAINAVCKKAMNMFTIQEEQFYYAFEKARLEVKKRLGTMASSHSRLLYFQRMLEIMGLRSQVLLALDFEQTYWRTFLSHTELFDHVKELLDELRLLGIPRAIVTDLTSQIQFRKIIYFDLEHYFDYIVTSEEVGYDKPHPAPFQLALEKMNLLSENPIVWMIGDNALNDIYGAKQAIQAITIQKVHARIKEGNDEKQPDAVINHFSQLIELLKKLAN